MVSVIVPNYNHARFLDERLSSILNQTYQDFELIILDDCSTDNSRDVINKYADNSHVSHIVFNDINSGSPFVQWNKGISLAIGEWIWIAESDDVADVRFLECMTKYALQYPSVGLIYCHLKAIDASGNELWRDECTCNRLYTGEEFARNKLILTTTIYNVSSCMFSQKAYKQIDPNIYTRYKKGGDYMFYIQLSEVTDVFECGNVLDGFRINKDSVSHGVSIDNHLDESFPMYKRLIDSYNIPQHVYAMTYAKQEFCKNYSRCEKKKLMMAYFENGMWLVPFCFVSYGLYSKWLPIKRFICRAKNFLFRRLGL